MDFSSRRPMPTRPHALRLCLTDSVRLVFLGIFAVFCTLFVPRVSFCAEDITPILKQLRSTDPFQRLAAAGRIAKLGPDGAAAVPHLIEALKCEEMDVLFSNPQIEASRQQFSQALEKIGSPAVAKLTEALKSDNGLVKVWAAAALMGIDKGRHKKQSIATLVGALEGGDEAAADAAQILENVGPDAIDAVPTLVRQLGDPDFGVRCGAAHALVAISKGTRSRAITDALSNKNLLVQVGASFVIAKTEPKQTEKAFPILKSGLKSKSAEVRRSAVWAIGQLGTAAQPIAQAVVDALPELEPSPFEYFFGGGMIGRQTFDASLVLVATGPEIKPALIEALNQGNIRSQMMASIALLRIDPTQSALTQPILKKAMESGDAGMNFMVSLALPPPNPKDKPSIDSLITQMLQANGFGFRSPATMMLAARGEEAVEPLMKIINGSDGVAAGKAAGALAAIGPPALPALTKAYEEGEAMQRVFAVNALAGMGKPAVSILAKAVKDELYPIQKAARMGLMAIGTPEASEALKNASSNQK